MAKTKTVVPLSASLSLTYMRIMRVCLLLVGAWSDDSFGRKTPIFGVIQQRTLSLQTLILFSGSIYYLYLEIESITFFVIGHVVITQALGIIIMARSISTNLKDYSPILKEFADFHLINHKHKGVHYEKMYKLTDKVSRLFTQFQLFAMLSGAFLFNVTPLYESYKMGAFKHPRPANQSYDYAIFFAYPGYRQDDHFYGTCVFNIYISFVCAIVVSGIDLLLTLIVIQIIGHIKTLMLNLESMPLPKVIIDVTNEFKAVRNKKEDLVQIEAVVLRYDDEENKVIHEQLTEMVDHHRFIYGFADRISNFFGPMLALNYLLHLCSGCILLLECSQKDPKALARFGPLTFVIFGQLVELSVVFEVVGYMSEKVIDSVYCIPWECMDNRNRRTMLFMFKKVQTPIQITAMGIVPVGVQTMLQIIKTTMTYFAMLQSLSE